MFYQLMWEYVIVYFSQWHLFVENRRYDTCELILFRNLKFPPFFSISSDDEDYMDDDEEQIAVAATFGISAVFNKPGGVGSKLSSGSPNRRKSGSSGGGSSSKSSVSSASSLPHHHHSGPSQSNVDKDRLTVDISALKQQYSKLRQRQKQAQIILSSKTY